METLKARRRQIQEVYLAREPLPQWNLTAVLEAADIPLKRVSPNELLSIAGSPNHQGFAAQVGPFPYVEFSEVLSASADQQGPVLILDEIQDPANLGSILRSGECLGVTAVILSKDRSVAVTPAVEKTSAGVAAHVPLARVVNLARAMDGLKESGYWIYATDSTGRGGLFCNGPHRQGCISIGIRRKGYPASSARKMRSRALNTDGRESRLAQRFTDSSYSIGRSASPALSHGTLNRFVNPAALLPFYKQHGPGQEADEIID